MFTTTQIIVALAVGLAVGVAAGAVAVDVLRAGPERRRRLLAERRAREQTFRAGQASQQAAAFSLLLRIATGGKVAVDDHLGSRRAPDGDEPTLRAV